MAERHLDDEQLSALLDGDDPGGDGRVHVSACSACAERLGRLRAGVALVGSPVATLDPAVADGLIARAVEDAGVVVAIGSSRRPPRAQWVAAVAAVLALLVGIPTLLRSSGTDSSRDSLALTDSEAEAGGGGGGSATDEFQESTAETENKAALSADAVTGSPTAASSPPAMIVDGDLGDHDDPDELVARLRSKLSTGPTAYYARRSSSGDDDADTGPRCVDDARAAASGRIGSLAYFAPLRWHGTTAEVLVFALTEPNDQATRQAYVMSRSGCSVLADPVF